MAANNTINADFADMKVAAEQFQNALENCQNTGQAVEGLKTQLMQAYTSSSSETYLPKLAAWQADLQKVEGALARMTLELAETNKDYVRIDDEAAEIANAIQAQLGG
jgi:uncharacterized protein YukE